MGVVGGTGTLADCTARLMNLAFIPSMRAHSVSKNYRVAVYQIYIFVFMITPKLVSCYSVENFSSMWAEMNMTRVNVCAKGKVKCVLWVLYGFNCDNLKWDK